ncbi:unnamed protein product [Calypogeia fissa]
MDSRRKARLVENTTNQCNSVLCNQEIVPVSGAARACQSCGQTVGSRSEPLGSLDAFPAGVKFDPSDEELLHHLRAEVGHVNVKPHPLINLFISILDGEDGICQMHPKHLPGVKKDGSSKHFFHRPAKAYTTGTRKRRKIHSEDDEPGVETRWHKTGKTRRVSENGLTLGWKKIMVLYRNTGAKKSKPEKTNWILHQYHLGETEEETDGELVVCKVFYQKQPRQCTGGRQGEGANEMENVDLNQGSRDASVTCISEISRGTPATPKVDTPQRPRSSRPDAAGKMRGQMTAQSSKGSELTVIGMEGQAPIASELTSTPAPYSNSTEVPPVTPVANFPNGGQTISLLVKTIHPTIAECYSGEWHGYEEVSTSAGRMSCQNETDNQVGEGIAAPMEREQEEPHQLCPGFGCESQQQFPANEDMLTCDEILADLLSLPRVDCGSGGEESYFSDPNPVYPYPEYEYTELTGSFPIIDEDYLISSQEADIINCGKATYTYLDNDDSLSST